MFLGKCPYCNDGQIEIRKKEVRGKKVELYACSNASWVTEDGKHNGCVITKRYNDEKKYIGQDTEFFIEYSDKLARQLIEIANKTNPNPKFYFKDGGRTIAVKEIENFTGDFKELMKLATRGEVI